MAKTAAKNALRKIPDAVLKFPAEFLAKGNRTRTEFKSHGDDGPGKPDQVTAGGTGFCQCDARVERVPNFHWRFASATRQTVWMFADAVGSVRSMGHVDAAKDWTIAHRSFDEHGQTQPFRDEHGKVIVTSSDLLGAHDDAFLTATPTIWAGHNSMRPAISTT